MYIHKDSKAGGCKADTKGDERHPKPYAVRKIGRNDAECECSSKRRDSV